MRRIAAFALITILAVGAALPSTAQRENRRIGENQAEAKRAAKQQQRYSKKQAKRQRKLMKKYQKAQKKAAKQGRHR